ncbi:MAG: hypothetical protein ACK5MI_08900 [Mangrovibacterium sp.]
MKTAIKDYLEQQYPHWLSYAAFHCRRISFIDEPADLLHEVMVNLLTTNKVLIPKLYQHEENGVRALHKYVLKMIKLNVYSPNSPYRRKLDAERLDLSSFHKIKRDTNYLAARYDDLKLRMSKHKLSEEEQQLLLWRLGGESLQSWPGNAPRHLVYRRFQKLFLKVSSKP